MARKQQYTVAQVIAALRKNKGMVFVTAKQLKCTPETIQNYCKRYPTVQAAKDAERGEMVDTAELKLWQSIQNGEAWGITLALKTIGKDRGYVERTEQTGKDGAPLNEVVKVVMSKQEDTPSD
jgi:hypothetical protein